MIDVQVMLQSVAARPPGLLPSRPPEVIRRPTDYDMCDGAPVISGAAAP
jgi:hypothetical protein